MKGVAKSRTGVKVLLDLDRVLTSARGLET
jgi:hypothetical protein